MNKSIVQIRDIIKNDLCIGCGICTSESKEATMIWNIEGFLIPDITKPFNENAVRVCPFNPNPEETVADEDKLADYFIVDAPFRDPRIGKFHKIYTGFAKEFRATSSSGGLGTYLLKQLLESGIADHLFIVSEHEGSYAYRWMENIENLVEASKTRYYPVSMELLFKEIDSKKGKVAVIGIPPFLKAIRLKQFYYPKYREKISFLIGIICGGWKSKFFTDYLAQKAGVDGAYRNQEYRIKDFDSTSQDYAFGAYNTNDEFRQIKMREVIGMWNTGLFNANASDFSDDVTAELGDISLGDAWIRPHIYDGRGTSLFVTRSAAAEKLIQEGIYNGDLLLEELSLDKFVESQAGAFRHRHAGMKFRLHEIKKTGNLVPYKRKRLLQKIPVEYKALQKQRRVVRKASLSIWQESRSAEKFEHAIMKHIRKLEFLTNIYHIIQRIKKKLGISTL